MRVNISNIGASAIAKDTAAQEECITVPLRALDDYVAERSLQAGLIKTDLEGAEPDFLAGAKRQSAGKSPFSL